MRLRKINLSGFKSFVDPTTISFPGDIIAVVGPNGCGKSNVIDAVRWVMGESSAKHLRGDLMADVIFNGSLGRKPVGQAAVELVFDNSEGRLGERFAAYSEISVRRQVNRDGHSTYMLNGARCRRRDITDVFLGTGLGPRSYAIIEQGTISRLVEARPEELREFLEEAAGISRYKERRRETENRIRHTEENLERLDDLREELAGQLERLRRQAEQAERFKTLKGEERTLRSELLAVRWQTLSAQVERDGQGIAEQGNRVEAEMAEQRRIEAELERQREAQGAASEAFNESYRQVLEAGAEVGRIEEAIQSLRRQREELARRLEQERESLARTRQVAESDAERLTALLASLESVRPELQRREDATGEARVALEQAERDMAHFQRQWEQFNQRLAEPTRLAHGEQERIAHLETVLSSLGGRIARLEAERDEHDGAGPQAKLEGLQTRLQALEAERGEHEQRLGTLQSVVQRAREEGARAAEDLHREREQLQELRGRAASLEALQQGALGTKTEELERWLRAHGLEERARVAEALRVRPGWESALEVVLGAHLEAFRVADVWAHLPAVEALREGALGLVSSSARVDRPPRAGAGHGRPARPLAELVEAGLETVTEQVRAVAAVETLEHALELRDALGPGESVVTRDGLWIGPGWARVARGDAAGAGLLAREQALRETAAQIRATAERAADREEALAAAGDALRRAEAEREALSRALGEVQDCHATSRSELAALRAETEARTVRLRQVEEGLIELSVEREQTARTLAEARERLARAESDAAEVEQERVELRARREELERALDAARERWQAVRQDAYETGLQVESTRTQIAALEEGRERLVQQVRLLETRCADLQNEQEGLVGPLEEAQGRRETQLRRHAELERAHARARAQVEALDAALRDLESARSGAQSRAQAERDELGRRQIAAQETVVRRDTVREQLEEAGHQVEEVVAGMPPQANEPEWGARLEQVERRIARLGPINLAAIEEFDQQSERKRYLDAQHGDLTEALATLQEAIQKIDRDTRARFKDTYERVNDGLAEKFPRLFGGGSAYLQLTSEDLLEAGVAVMARPPGKRNSSIHLLSGGEKAMTAVALVFAIFDLNPAPFCLLDEVDAPLDDANVGRFGALVREMSEHVQVVLVTHNKVTMESARQLVGVTMNEPGVSRLVAVDLDSAVEMAAD